MNSRVHLLALSLLLLTGCTTTGRHGVASAQIAVTIPYDTHGGRAAWIDCHPPYPFHVLLTNVSGKPLRLWQEWCSWGYYSLQFELVGPDGQKHLLKKRPTAFYMNFPDYFVLRPGDSAVWEVEFASSVWEDLSWISADRAAKCHLKAIYSVDLDEDSSQHAVWTGRVASPSYDVSMERAAQYETK